MRLSALLLVVGILLLALTPAFADSGNATGACCASSCVLYVVIVLVINVLILAWVVSDAHKRGTTSVGWFLIVFIFGLIGLIAYLVMRPQGKLQACSNCGQMRPITALICPHCGQKA